MAKNLVLQPIFFSSENREQISAGSLWEKTDALMTNAVSKNLKIKGMIATSLEYEKVIQLRCLMLLNWMFFSKLKIQLTKDRL